MIAEETKKAGFCQELSADGKVLGQELSSDEGNKDSLISADANKQAVRS